MSKTRKRFLQTVDATPTLLPDPGYESDDTVPKDNTTSSTKTPTLKAEWKMCNEGEHLQDT